MDERTCRLGERVALPETGASVTVVGIEPTAVRLRIERGPGAPPMPTHRLCNRLNRLTLTLQLFSRQWELGLPDAAATLRSALELIDALGCEASGEAAAAPRPDGNASGP